MRFNQKARKGGGFVIANALTNSRIGGISRVYPFPEMGRGGGGHVIGNDHRHGCTGPISIRRAEVSCPNIFSIACRKTSGFARIWLFEKL